MVKNCLKKQKNCSLGLVIKKKLLNMQNLTLRGAVQSTLLQLFKAIYYRDLSIDKAERKQDEFETHLTALEKYRPRNLDYVTIREKLLTNVKNFYDGKEMIINAFKDKIFPLHLKMIILKITTKMRMNFTLQENYYQYLNFLLSELKKKRQEI